MTTAVSQPIDTHTDAATQHVRIAIVGAGFAGLAAGVHLQRAGEQDYLIIERAQEVGGVWRDNSYPGAACDVPSHLYSLSFAPNSQWSRSFSAQPEIYDYLRSVATDFGLRPRIRFGQELLDASWDDDARHWVIVTTGMRFTADVLIDGTGPLTEPQWPDIPGIETFAGAAFHSARWDHDYDLRGTRVAVIGSGASSIQFVPEIQPDVEHMVLVQRTAPWVIPRNDRTITSAEKRLLHRVPVLARAARGAQYLVRELFYFPMVTSSRVRSVVQRVALAHMHKQVADPVLRTRLTPDFAIACKRVLISNTWYPAITQPNVEIVGGVTEVRPHSIVTDDGAEHEIDAIILGTGFHVADAPLAKHIHGRDGRSLGEVWGDHPRAYRGTTVSGFPNLFRLGGVGTATGHNSHIFQEEAQLTYVLDALRTMRERGLDSVDVLPDAQRAYDAYTSRVVKDTVWAVGGCKSWYLDDSGQASVVWPCSTVTFRKTTSRFDPQAYELRTADRRPAAAATAGAS